ncbi:hypothetical protein ACFWG5_35040 [Streptomyces hydrogenans]
MRFDQRHRGVPVLGATYLVHTDATTVTSAAGSHPLPHRGPAGLSEEA